MPLLILAAIALLTSPSRRKTLSGQPSSSDLSRDQDLSIAVMNLVSLEEHYFFSYKRTGDDRFLDLMKSVREMRRALMERLVSNTSGETWCITKHLLAATMRLIETGNKYQTQGDLASVKDMFNRAYALYNMFWAARDGKSICPCKITAITQGQQVPDFVTENVNCCDEK